MEARAALSRSGIANLPSSQNSVKADVAPVPPISGPPPAAVASVNGSVLVRQQVAVGNMRPATVKMEPTTVTGPAFPHMAFVPRPTSQAVPSLQTSSPLLTSQELVTNNEYVPDIKPLVNNVPTSSRPLSGAARILNDVAQARGRPAMGGTPMLSDMISSGTTSSITPAQNVVASGPSGPTSISGSLPISMPTIQLGQAPISQGNLPVATQMAATQMVQTGMNSMNQNIMSVSGGPSAGINSGMGSMMPTPGMSQQGQPTMQQPLGVNGNNAVANMPLNQQMPGTMQTAQSKYVEVSEGNLSGQRQGQPVFITRMEGYRSASASET